jgi:hypothetical protein
VKRDKGGHCVMTKRLIQSWIARAILSKDSSAEVSNDITRLQITLHTHNNKDSMVLAQNQTLRWVE